MSSSPAIIWFRQDLRRKDNPALLAAYDQGRPVIPVYILDDDNAGEWKMGAASRWWLHHSLKSLNDSLSGHLLLFKGNPQDILEDLIQKAGATSLYWNRCYEPWRVNRDKEIKAALKEKDFDVQSFNGALLYEPHQTNKDDGDPYRVFTPFFKKGCLGKNGQPPSPEAAPDRLTYGETDKIESLELDALNLLPDIRWDQKMEQYWTPGEDGAQERLQEFVENGLNGYKEDRNRPDLENVSRLSPHLHWGEISPRDVWHVAGQRAAADGLEKDGYHFHSELGWREFSYNLLFNNHDLPSKNLQTKFDHFPWADSEGDTLERWQKGQTGYPIVDAGMRELYETGYMHNRVRMIVGSFLVKHLLLHWKHGEDWFWDTLVDADLANNAASWQWVAGSGADAAPYFRIFNPITQGEKFDPKGIYTRQFVPELYDLPNKYLFKPWEAPEDVLEKCGIELGKTYPKPIVDHMSARKRALSAFEELKNKAA